MFELIGIKVKGLGKQPLKDIDSEIKSFFDSRKESMERKGSIDPVLYMVHKKMGRGIIVMDFSTREEKKRNCWIISKIIESMREELELVMFASDGYYRKVAEEDLDEQRMGDKPISEHIDSREALLCWATKPNGEYRSKVQEYLRINSEREIIWGEVQESADANGFEDNMFGKIF